VASYTGWLREVVEMAETDFGPAADAGRGETDPSVHQQ
jgi:hypothetical protein